MKILKNFRLSPEAVEILDEQDNATEFIEKLILQPKTISKGEALILDRLDKMELKGKNAFEHAAITGEKVTIPPIPDLGQVLKEGNECCKLKKPCKHWQWDGTNQNWVNTLTGEVKEA